MVAPSEFTQNNPGGGILFPGWWSRHVIVNALHVAFQFRLVDKSGHSGMTYAKGWINNMAPQLMLNQSIGLWEGYWHGGALAGLGFMARGNDGIQMAGMISNRILVNFEMASLTYRIRDNLENGWPNHDLFESD